MSTTEASNEKASSPPDGPLSELKLKPSDKLGRLSIPPEESPPADLRVTAPVEGDPKPVSFFTLFRSVFVSFHVPICNLYTVLRFSTRTELILNGLSLIAAAAAGAAQVCVWPSSTPPSPCVSTFSTDEYPSQPLMSLLFGDLTQDFIDFSNGIKAIDPNDPQSTAKFDEVVERFRHVSAQDASYLTYIGT